ncbi:MAG: hypothetical protein LKCHEGNO_00269 [Burkholderiaceae bacterium]|nr:hypothetical protein [Burkholderiaceae bacterium]
MPRRARERRVYDVLHQAELVYYLDTQPAAFDIVISADTLCYFGALEAALAAARASLRDDGCLIFTVEALAAGDARDHALNANGRYAHGQPYLERALAAAGFASATLQPVALRLEAGLPVEGWLVSARLAHEPTRSSASRRA